jgi:diacylglycerol kinase family enzyme
VREVTVTADPPQKVQVDGEILMETPVTARDPEAVKVIVPAAVDA